MISIETDNEFELYCPKHVFFYGKNRIITSELKLLIYCTLFTYLEKQIFWQLLSLTSPLRISI